MAIHHDAAADTGSEDDAEHRFITLGRSEGGLRQSAAVSVVGEQYPATQRAGEIHGEGFSVQAEGIRVLEKSRLRHGDSGGTDADEGRALQSGGIFQFPDEARELGQDVFVSLRRLRRHAESPDSLGWLVRIQDRPLDFRPAKVDAPEGRACR